MTEYYSSEKQRKLADKIHYLKKLDVPKEQQNAYFKEIKKIITENNTDAEFVKNSNGYLTQFQNFTYETYIKLEKFVSRIERHRLRKEKIENSILNSQTDLASEDVLKRKKEYSKKLRLTNTETHLLNRARYEKELKKNDNCDNSDADDDYYNTSHNKFTETEKPTEKVQSSNSPVKEFLVAELVEKSEVEEPVNIFVKTTKAKKPRNIKKN